MPVHRPDRERGIALVTVLWALAFLSILALSLVVAGRGETPGSGRNLADGARAQGPRRRRRLAHRAARRPRSRPGAGAATGATRRPRSFGEGEVRIAVQDEAGKVDINAASNALLQALALSAGVTPTRSAIADAIEDWRDTDDLRRANGADRSCGSPARSYGPTNRRFENVEELQLVLGVTQPVAERLAERVTVYSGQRGIDPMSAPPQVLGILPGAWSGVGRAPDLAARERHHAGEHHQRPLLAVLRRRPRRGGDGPRRRSQPGSQSPRCGGATTNDIQTPYLVIRWKRGARRLLE